MRQKGAITQSDLTHVKTAISNASLPAKISDYIEYKLCAQSKRLNSFHTEALEKYKKPPIMNARHAGTQHPITAVRSRDDSDGQLSYYEIPKQLEKSDIDELLQQGFSANRKMIKTAKLGHGKFGDVSLAKRMNSLNKDPLWTAQKIAQEDADHLDGLISEIDITKKLSKLRETTRKHIGFASLDHSDIYKGTQDKDFEVQIFFELGQPIKKQIDVPTTEIEKLQFATVLTDKLAILHNAGISHMDIKPDNIIKDLEGEPAFTDFGFSTKNQMAEVLNGSMRYSPPECYTGDSYDTRKKDVYSLALTILELIGETELVRPNLPKKLSIKKQLETFFELRETEFNKLGDSPGSLVGTLVKALDPIPSTRMNAKTFANAISKVTKIHENSQIIDARKIETENRPVSDLIKT